MCTIGIAQNLESNNVGGSLRTEQVDSKVGDDDLMGKVMKSKKTIKYQ